MKEILLKFLIELNDKGLINNHDFDYEEVSQDFANKDENKVLIIASVGNSFAWEEVEEFGRQAFYNGREVERYNENGLAIFKRPTYNGYLRELDSK